MAWLPPRDDDPATVWMPNIRAILLMSWPSRLPLINAIIGRSPIRR
jgi:hypothetical protein